MTAVPLVESESLCIMFDSAGLRELCTGSREQGNKQNISREQGNIAKIRSNKGTLTSAGIRECFPRSIFQGLMQVILSHFKVELKCNRISSYSISVKQTCMLLFAYFA